MSTARIRCIHTRAQAIAAQARRRPWTAKAARNWLRLAARHAERRGLSELAQRVAALEHDILDL